jgi:DNA-binding transcriptional MerR regulator
VSETGESAPARPAPDRPAKGASAFRTIGEVASDLDLPAHVLRFWESKFPQLKPLKRGGGRRYYRPEDVALLRRIRQCLYQDGYTIRGVRQLLGADSGGPTRDPAAAPTLFPLELAAAPAAASDEAPEQPTGPAKPARRSRRRPIAPDAKADTKAALEEIRRELLEARALLDELLRRRKVP